MSDDVFDTICDRCAEEFSSDEANTPAFGEWAFATICNECYPECEDEGAM